MLGNAVCDVTLSGKKVCCAQEVYTAPGYLLIIISCRGPEIQSNPACTHTSNTTDSYSCYVSAEFSLICEKTPI